MPGRALRGKVAVIGLLIVGGLAFPVQAGDDGALSAAVRRLVEGGKYGKMRVGVRVESLGPGGRVLYEHDSEELFKPASNQKVITTAAALAMLPNGFTYKTILAYRGDDLIVIGSGDPSLGDPYFAEKAGEEITGIFHRWAAALKKSGITRIEGDLLFDDFIFEQQHIHPSWAKQHNLQTWYAAPVGGLNFNDNCIDLVIKPGDKPGAPADVRVVPDTTYTELINKSVTASKGEPLITRKDGDPMEVYVSKQVSRSNEGSPFSLTVIDPGSFFACTLRTVLAAKGIEVVGQTRRQRIRLLDGELPADLTIVAVQETRLNDILWRVNKCSQNMFAEALFKTMGAYVGPNKQNRQGSYESGRAVIRLFLENAGAETEGLVFDDGSGLSHNNRVTPEAIVKSLAYMDKHPLRDVYLNSMAEPGEKVGTLRKRMKDLKGQVYAKTGYIRGVSVLSGYVIGNDGRRYAFSVLCNDTNRHKGGFRLARKLQEDVCETLATFADEPATAHGG